MRVQSSTVGREYRIVAQNRSRHHKSKLSDRQLSETDFSRPKQPPAAPENNPSKPNAKAAKENRFKILKVQNNFLDHLRKPPLDADLPRPSPASDILQAKRLLYVYNNEIKNEFNSLVLENKQMETRIKQLRKEREQLERELAVGKGRAASVSRKRSMARAEVQLQLKDTLKAKKEQFEQLKAELKNLRQLLRDETMTQLKNENIALLNSLTQLRQGVVEQLTVAAGEDGRADGPSKLTQSNYAECVRLLGQKRRKKEKIEVC